MSVLAHEFEAVNGLMSNMSKWVAIKDGSVRDVLAAYRKTRKPLFTDD